MELALFVYLAGMVGKVSTFFALLASVSAFALVPVVFYFILSGKALKKRYILIPVLCGLISSMIPSERTMYMVLAGYSTQHVIQSDTGEKIKKVVDAKLDYYLNELQSKGDKK